MKSVKEYKVEHKRKKCIDFILMGMYGYTNNSYIKRDIYRRIKRRYRETRPNKTRKIKTI